MWFPRLSSDRALRRHPVEGPFVTILRTGNADRIHCLNPAAEAARLWRGMALSEARAFCPGLQTRPADPLREAWSLGALRRWALRYCPWVGLEGEEGLVLDITGAAHLWGGEPAMLDDMRAQMARAGLHLRLGLADTRGAAWALAHHAEGIAPPGRTAGALAPLPVAALRLDEATDTALQRLGLRRIGALMAAPRAPLARRFGPGLLLRLDQATGAQPEAVTPLTEPPRFAARLTLPEPLGLSADVMAATARLLQAVCAKLHAQEAGARALRLTLRRVDQAGLRVDLPLAAPMRDPERILPLFTRGIKALDSGWGIDQIHLEAVSVEPLPARQIGQGTSQGASRGPERLADLVTRIGTRIGLENICRFQPADSHIPERGFVLRPAVGGAEPAPQPQPRIGTGTGTRPPAAAPRSTSGIDPLTWPAPPRPLLLFPPEPILAAAPSQPPARFRWRRMRLTTARATGPERIAPEWWLAEDDAWRSGLRDYWRIETREGRRLWLFHTPQDPGWFVQGEFA